ncbi:callose synthase 3-like [Dorcoceras hygrometricum]|uniref:Callose synthase 3-like n=1 Tax=Dorcoceras hygrometricum TaxID=472368 RepID=A0A2Z7ALH7_9LAMI|nr:callose synthase 3-like [Dorcoceras hygrometricum]
MGNSSAYVSAIVGSRSIEKTVLLTSASCHMFRGNSDACVSATVESLTIKKTVLLTSFHLIIFNGNRSAYTNSEIDLSSSDGSTVYRSPSPISPEVDSFEHDLRFALGPAILSSVEQEERLYFVQSPESCPAASPHPESSPSSTDVSVHFDSTDVPLNAQADTRASETVDFSMLTDSLEDLRSSIFQRIHDLIQGTTQATQINDLNKGLMAPFGTIFGDLFDIKKKQREQDAKLIALDGQIAAIRSEQLDFQTKIAADILSLSTQVGDIADYIRGGDAKKGEIGSSSRPSTVRTQTHTFPPTTGTFAERAEQTRRHIIESGQVISIEEAAERVIEADRRESDRLERERERERRERRQSRRGTYKRRRGY